MYDVRWHGGAYYVQSSTSMLLELAWRTIERDFAPQWILDACAAPGGKTTHLASLMREDAMIVANEVDGKRASTLLENLTRWGQGNHMIIQSPIRKISIQRPFEVIALDAPCSGEGLFAEYEIARNRWSLDHVKKSAEIQRSILQDAWSLLAPGGYLIYSTCTSNHYENQGVIQFAQEKLGAQSIRIEEAPLYTHELGTTGIGYQSFPHMNKGRAFFFALLRKEGQLIQERNSKPRAKTETQSPFYQKREDEELIVSSKGIHLVPRKFTQEIGHLIKHHKCWKVGHTISDERGLKPGHGLLHALNNDVETLEVDYTAATAYLKGETLPSSGKGWKVVTCNGVKLGWIKSVQGRSNNHYPKSWRIPPSTKTKDLEDFTLN